MIKVLDYLKSLNIENNDFLIYQGKHYKVKDILDFDSKIDLSPIHQGDVVALIGDFTPRNIYLLLKLIDLQVILVPLTLDTKAQHATYIEEAKINVVIDETGKINVLSSPKSDPFIDNLRAKGCAGLVLFSSGTTGKPKAILHNFDNFLKRYFTPRKAFVTLSFLMFDHVGGINTILHTIFNKGLIVIPSERTVESIINDIKKYKVELLPTTPTFLRMMLMSGELSQLQTSQFSSLKLITYGTERMDQTTLDAITKILPNVDFRQTYGMSELGILRIKTEARDSLYMSIGGEGVEVKAVDHKLYIRAKNAMEGYLNAPSPFDEDGWYNTKDLVDEKEIGNTTYYKIIGRDSDLINVGGLKFMPADVENLVLQFEGIKFCKVKAVKNPITGEYPELIYQTNDDNEIDLKELKQYLKDKLPAYMLPRKYIHQNLKIGHRFKKL